MLDRSTLALDSTHAYLQSMGARVAPDKSFNFASNKVARDWLMYTCGATSNKESRSTRTLDILEHT